MKEREENSRMEGGWDGRMGREGMGGSGGKKNQREGREEGRKAEDGLERG